MGGGGIESGCSLRVQQTKPLVLYDPDNLLTGGERQAATALGDGHENLEALSVRVRVREDCGMANST